jgi:hypothetical protein
MQKRENENWIKEIARDLLALGSLPFFILVLARVSLLNNPVYLTKFLIAGIIFLIFAFIFKADLYSGLGFVMLFFTNLYYLDLKYLFFSSIVYILLIASLFYFKEKNKILKGLVLGIAVSLISYYVVSLWS